MDSYIIWIVIIYHRLALNASSGKGVPSALIITVKREYIQTSSHADPILAHGVVNCKPISDAALRVGVV